MLKIIWNFFVYPITMLYLLFTYHLNGYLIGDKGLCNSIFQSRQKKVFLAEFEPRVRNIFIADSTNPISFKIEEVWFEYSWHYTGWIYPKITYTYMNLCIRISKKKGTSWFLALDGHRTSSSKEIFHTSIEKSKLDSLIKNGFQLSVKQRNSKKPKEVAILETIYFNFVHNKQI